MKKPPPRTAREHAQERIDVARYNESMFGDLRAAKGIAAPVIEDLPAVVHRRPARSPQELEAGVSRAITEMLALHPLVAFAARYNSGAAWMPGKGGKDMPVYFYRIIRPHEKMRIVDFGGLLKDGRPWAIESKRPGWKQNLSDEREAGQARYMQMVRSLGGVAGFATSVDEAIRILEAK